jgi:hypothetical protein
VDTQAHQGKEGGGLMNRLDALSQAVQLSQQVGRHRINHQRKEELYQDLMDLVNQWELTREEIEICARTDHKERGRR